MDEETELEILTVRRVTVSPITRPDKVNRVSIMKGVFEKVIPIKIAISADIDETIAILFGRRAVTKVGSNPLPIARVKQRAVL